MERKIRIAVVAGITIAIASVALVLSLASSDRQIVPSEEDNIENTIPNESRQITVEPSESLSVEAK